jgi:hypothetical protein
VMVLAGVEGPAGWRAQHEISGRLTCVIGCGGAEIE